MLGIGNPGGTVVLALGNPLMGDDGIGLAALERLQQEWEVPPDVELADGGTWGMRLLPVIEDAERLILVDAINFGVAPGTLVVLEREDLPKFMDIKLSPHEIAVREVLALAEVRGRLPEHTVAIGLQPDTIEMRTALSPAVAAEMDGLVEAVVARLEQWGHRCTALPVKSHA